MTGPAVRVAVVGAGAAGLAAALALQARGARVTLLERGPRPGGVMQTGRRDGFVFERGPNTLRVGGPGLAVLRAAGLEAALLRAAPASRERYLLREGGLVPVPMDPLSFARSSLLTARGKLRLLAEPFVRRGDPTGETVAGFVARRLGPETVDALVGPFLVGVYAGDERALGAEAVFPSLVAHERRRGSIVRGAVLQALAGGGERGLPGTWSAREGLGGLAGLLARGLHGPLATGTRVAALSRDGAGFRLATEGPEGPDELRASAVVLATDAPSAAGLLEGVDPEAAALARTVAYAPVVSLALAVDPVEARRHPIRGFGFLVPRDQGLDLLGALFMSRLFPGRAPEGRELVTAMLGGVRWPGAAEASDEALLERALAGLERALGVRSAGLLAASRWPRAVPQPGPDHGTRVRVLRERLARTPGLAVAGSWLDGVGVSDTLACGARAGREIALPHG